MPLYKVVSKPFWTVDGPVQPGETVELAEEVAAPFVPGNLELVQAKKAAPPAKTVESPPKKRGEK